MKAFEAPRARTALAQLPDLAAQESLDPPQLTRVYVPLQHAKAVHLDASVVVGMRGAGKSWWTAVLASDTHRRFVSQQLQASSLARVSASVAFGLDDTESQFPRPETLWQIIADRVEPIDIWQTVVLRHVLRATDQRVPFPQMAWKEGVRWFIQNRDRANGLITACDEQLKSAGRVVLVLFDAFDRLATDWDKVRRLTMGALQLGLRLRSRSAIRAKFFIRPDVEEDDEVWRFPDSSKLRHAKVDLTWSSADLYGLVFMHIGNSQTFGAEFRQATSDAVGAEWSSPEGVYVPPGALLRDEHQRTVLEGLADRTMGSDPKRGYTYSWVPLHLADAKGRISPRSYILAFKQAAEGTASQRSDHNLALHFKNIQDGVVKASDVRVHEIAEDYPWVQPLLEAARNAVVPISAVELARLWTPDCLRRMTRAGEKKLPPRRYTSDPIRRGRHEALIDDLVELAVFYRTKDRRLNMPDIFRVGFGIRRKGGVRPPR
jgi:hypothetical protein